MLAEHFNALSLRSLHPYRDSLTFALLLLIAGGKDEKISAVLESFCRHAPEPDGRLKWFLEESIFETAMEHFSAWNRFC